MIQSNVKMEFLKKVSNLIELLVSDNYDIIRINAIQCIVFTWKAGEGSNIQSKMISLLQKMFKDESWRVRYQMCILIELVKLLLILDYFNI